MPMVTKKAVAVSLTSETRQRRGSKKKIDVLILLLLLRQTRGQSSRAGKLNACRSHHARKITRGMESGSVVTEWSLAGSRHVDPLLAQSHHANMLFTRTLQLSSSSHP